MYVHIKSIISKLLITVTYQLRLIFASYYYYYYYSIHVNSCLLTCLANSHMANYKNSTAQTHNDKQYTNETEARKTNRTIHHSL
jgi:hypothetical protein